MSKACTPGARRVALKVVVPLALAAAALSASSAPAQTSQATIDSLTRDAAARFAFTRKLQGRWTCTRATSGKPLKATMLLFTLTPTVYHFEVTPTPASPKWSNIIESWKWEWSFGTYGRWFSTADPRTAGAGIQYVSDGWDGSTLLWKEHVSPSTITRTFELLPDGGLALGVRDRSAAAHPDDSYRLTCRRALPH
jgi:hypothetical protein